MGWISTILAPVLKVGAGVLLGEGGAALIGSLFGDETVEDKITAEATALTGGGATGTIARTARGVPISTGPRSAGVVTEEMILAKELAERGGGQKNFTVTTVTTKDPTGRIVRIETLDGRPFIMQKDIVIAKRVFRQSRKLGAKLPKRTVKESATTKLKDQVIAQAMQNLICAPACPTKPC